ncbi:MAG TPA: glycosyltransferase [Pyrinomonadaceae bacterium]|jgi:cellulose synthase/poly-beta-1,6-N-acetylglucosamine synthase-like glycosyltransferase/peptidoglycan/xylan/chitin deacetylase (PgdA/CDA1 family)/spore germination protein YaaH
MEALPGTPVFYDPKGRRWRRVKRTYLVLAICVTAITAIFIASVLANPLLPRLNLRPLANLPHPSDIKPKPLAVPPANAREQKAKRAQAELQKALATTRVVPAQRRELMPIIPQPANIPLPAPASFNSRQLAVGFYVNWDESSLASLRRNLDHLDWVVPQWVHIVDVKNGSNPLATDIDAPALNLIRQQRPQISILPMIQNLNDEQWESDVLARAVADEPARQNLIAALVSFVGQNKFAGVCVDFEEPANETQPNLLLFMQELHAAFQPRGWIVAQAVPFDSDQWNYKAYAAASDYLMLMAYDQHWASGKNGAGSVAGQSWYEQLLVSRMKDLDPAKTIIALGNYGYDWTAGSDNVNEVTVQEALISARDSGPAEIKFDLATQNPHYEYDEDDGSHHSVWFLDAVTAYNQMRAASGYHPAGFALWRLGSEDPSVWSVFGSSQTAASPEALRRILYGYQVDFEGTGELLRVAARPHDGARDIKVDPSSGFITTETYDPNNIPSSYVIERAGDHPGLIALTFDDGPDPRWTPAILDILKQENVPATFFIIGKNGQAYPDLLRRIVNEGHEIGNHTFTHPNLGEIPGRITDLELNATQRLIESVTGRSTVLFRPPFFGDAEADKPEEVEPAFRAQRMGYIMVGLRLDPDDWQTPVSPDEIVNRTVEQAMYTDPDKRGQVVLLHDSGGDRSATVTALPGLIHELRRRGFRFVPVSELAGLSRDQVMPILPPGGSVYTRTDAVAFFLMSTGGWLLQWAFLIGIGLGLGRLVVVGALAFAQWVRSKKRRRVNAGKDYLPVVSIIVPAYNEEAVIGETIQSLLRSDYKRYEIIVVDDGSQDRTSEVVRERFSHDDRVRLFTEKNKGKALALNLGLSHAKGEIIVALDADTVFTPETIGALAHRFHDPKMGALAGNAKVGNRINIVTRWQALEYITAQNMDRRAFASLNCITVVPGAVGAWRRALLERVGGFSSDTLAEDQDLTLSIRKLGYNIGYEEDAIAWTEAPDSLRGLARQRHRWAYGTLQCMWKHRNALFNPRYGALGWIAMPNVWIFQILFPLISPVMDLMLVYTLLSAGLERLQQPAGYSFTNLRQVLFYYALFLAVDWCAAGFAFILERSERWRLLWWLFLQRFCYRQVMYYVMIKSVATATRGALVSWGKLERKATVELRP